MALVWADFPSGQRGLYGTTDSKMLDGLWAELVEDSGNVTLASDPDPGIGSAGYVLKCDVTSVASGNKRGCARIVYPTARNTVGVGFRLWMPELPAVAKNCPLLTFRDNTNTICSNLAIGISTTGQLENWNHDSANPTLQNSTTGPVLTAGAWNHIEIKVTTSTTVGALEVRVNGTAEFTLSGQNFGSAAVAQLRIGVHKAAAETDTYTAYFKDFYMFDDQGSDVNDFQGSVSVYDLVPVSDSSLNWTPSTGSTGWDLIDEGDSGPVDSDYISADDSPPAAAIFNMSNLPADVTSVKGVISIGRAKKTDGGDCTVQMAVSPNGTDWDNGADNAITTAFTYRWDVSHVSPDTAVAWTPSEVDSILMRIDRTT